MELTMPLAPPAIELTMPLPLAPPAIKLTMPLPLAHPAIELTILLTSYAMRLTSREQHSRSGGQAEVHGSELQLGQCHQ